MDNVRIQQNQTERIEVYFANTAGVALSGLTPNLTVRRQSDGWFWTGGQDFTSIFTQVVMSAVNSVSIGGLYERTFDTTGLADDNYTLIASGTGAGNNPLVGELKVGGYVDNLNASISSIGPLGGSLIHLDGVFSKDEKEKLINLISDSVTHIIKKIEDAIISIKLLKSTLENETHNDPQDELKNESIDRLLKILDESKKLREFVPCLT